MIDIRKIAEAAIKNGKLIDEDLLEVIPKIISNSCLDDCVNLDDVRPFFTDDAWKLLE